MSLKYFIQIHISIYIQEYYIQNCIEMHHIVIERRPIYR